MKNDSDSKNHSPAEGDTENDENRKSGDTNSDKQVFIEELDSASEKTDATFRSLSNMLHKNLNFRKQYFTSLPSDLSVHKSNFFESLNWGSVSGHLEFMKSLGSSSRLKLHADLIRSVNAAASSLKQTAMAAFDINKHISKSFALQDAKLAIKNSVLERAMGESLASAIRLNKNTAIDILKNSQKSNFLKTVLLQEKMAKSLNLQSEIRKTLASIPRETQRNAFLQISDQISLNRKSLLDSAKNAFASLTETLNAEMSGTSKREFEFADVITEVDSLAEQVDSEDFWQKVNQLVDSTIAKIKTGKLSHPLTIMLIQVLLTLIGNITVTIITGRFQSSTPPDHNINIVIKETKKEVTRSFPSLKTNNLRIVASDKANVFDSHKKHREEVAELYGGSVVEIVARQKKWRLVRWFDEECGEYFSGWIRAKYLTKVRNEHLN